MVTNEDIKQRIRDKREGKGKNKYLVCGKCGGYYELQTGESAEDFELCRCGGKLKFVNSIEVKKPSKEKIKTKEKKEDIYDSFLEEINQENYPFKHLIRFVEMINNSINLAAIFIGLAVSVVFFILST